MTGGPVNFTNTNAIGQVYAGIQQWTQSTFGEATWPVVAETWDGRLNDLGGFHVKPETAIAAIEAAKRWGHFCTNRRISCVQLQGVKL